MCHLVVITRGFKVLPLGSGGIIISKLNKNCHISSSSSSSNLTGVNGEFNLQQVINGNLMSAM